MFSGIAGLQSSTLSPKNGRVPDCPLTITVEPMRTVHFVLILLACIAVPVRFAAGDELTVAQAIDLFDRATQGIQSYDVGLEVMRHWTAKNEVIGTKDVGGRRPERITEWRALRTGEAGGSQTSKWRQIRDSRGRRRIERISPASEKSGFVMTFDGELRRHLSEQQHEGSIGPANPRYIDHDEDYIAWYANYNGDASLVPLLRKRKGTRLIGDPDRPGAIVLDSPPELGAGLSQLGFTIFLDTEHGMLPSRIDVRRKSRETGEEPLWGTMLVRKFKKLDNGAWAPIEVANTAYAEQGPIKGSPTQEAVGVVDVAKSSWNKQYPDATFTIAFPKGVKVLDDLRKVTYVTGNPNREENLDELLKQAKDILPNAAHYEKEPPPKSTSWALILVVALGVAIVLGIAGLVSLRYARSRSPD